MGGLYLSGLVISVRHEDKEWEGEKYRQTVLGITDGEQTFEFRKRHEKDQTDASFPKFGQQTRIKVLRAMTEKGRITVSGTFI